MKDLKLQHQITVFAIVRPGDSPVFEPVPLPASLRTADVFPVVASLPPSAVRRLSPPLTHTADVELGSLVRMGSTTVHHHIEMTVEEILAAKMAPSSIYLKW